MSRQNASERQASQRAARNNRFDFMDWYTNQFNPTQASPGWTDAVQAGNNAIATGQLLAPNRPAGVEPGGVKPVDGAVDARTGNTASATSAGALHALQGSTQTELNRKDAT